MTLSSTPMLLRSILAAALAWSVAAQPLDVDNRIVGGDEAEPGDYPYYVDMWGCGGALIAPDIVLFAAHCGDMAEDMQVNIGAYLPRAEAYGSQTRFCDVWIPDPDYTTGPANSDFALCKLDRPVDMLANNPNDKQVFLELNKDGDLPASGDPLLVMGLGHTTEGGERSETLRDVEVPYLSNEECNSNDRYQGYITDLMMCAGFPDTGGKDACQGDSGGPIVKRVEMPDGTIVDTHVGVVSWGVGCARENFPGVYSRTSSRYDWIVDTMCETLDSVSDLCKDEDADADAEEDDWREELEEDFVCENDDEHLFTVSLTTDKYGSETSWLLSEEESGQWLKRRKFLVNYHAEEVSICLQSDTCYEWVIRDAYGDGMCTNSGGCGNYKLILEGETKYTGNPRFGEEDTYSFCTSTKTPPTKSPEPDDENIPEPDSSDEDEDEEEPPVSPTNPPDTAPPDDVDNDIDDTSAPSAYPTLRGTTLSPTTNFPTQVPTREPTISPAPSEAPSGSPSGAPTASMTPAPSEAPTGSPSGAPTASVTPEPTTCEDDPNFRYKKKSKWTCEAFLRGKKARRTKKRCIKKYRKKFIHEWCPGTCGAKAGEGRCEHLENSGKKGAGRRKKKRQEKAAAAESSSNSSISTMSRLDDGPKEEEHISDNIFVSTSFNHGRDRGDWHGGNNSWLSFESTSGTTTTTTTSGDGKFRKLIQNKTRRN